MSGAINIRQIAQYPRASTAAPGDMALIQQGGLGGPYASIAPADLVGSALANGGNLTLAPGSSISCVNAQLTSDGLFFASNVPFEAPEIFAPAIAADTILVGPDLQPVVTRADAVTSFNGRTGDVMLEVQDIMRGGGAPAVNPHLGGWATAPTAPDPSLSDDTIATAAWTQRAMCAFLEGWLELQPLVFTFNGRFGNVVLSTADVNQAYATIDGTVPTAPNPGLGDASSRIATTLFVDESLDDLHTTVSNEWNSADNYLLNLIQTRYAPLASPNFTGMPTAPTANPGANTGQLATTAFVHAAVTASTTGVASFNTRTGAVVLTGADVTGAGGALLASPAFTGTPTAPTATAGTSNTQLATTAFVAAAVTASAAGVASFNGRTGAVLLTLADVTGTNVLANTALTGVPTAPTAAPGTSTTQIATTAFVAASAAAGVNSFNGRTGAVTLIGADVSAAGGALNASPALTGTPTAPTPVTADSSTTLATTAFVHAVMAAGGGVTSFNTRSGAVTLTAADVTGVGGALLAGPAFTGVPTAPTPATSDNSTTLATTAFVQSLLTGGGATPGWTFSLLSGTSSKMVATGSTAGATFGMNGGTLNFQNKNGGAVCGINDTTINSSLGSINYPILRNALSGSPAVLSVGGTDANRSIQLVPVGTGTVQVPTMAPGDNSTAAASTAFVTNAIPAAGGPVLLATLTASNSASLSDITHITSAYQVYEIDLIDILPATNGVSVELQVHSAGAFQAASYLTNYGFTSGTVNTMTVSSAVTTYIPLYPTSQAANTGPGISGVIRLYNPSGTTAPKMVNGTVCQYNGSIIVTGTIGGYWNANGAVDGFQILFSSGNITSGTVKIYGIP